MIRSFLLYPVAIPMNPDCSIKIPWIRIPEYRATATRSAASGRDSRGYPLF